MKKKKPGRRKWKIWVSIVFLLIISYLTYYQLWYKSPRVDSNIFKLAAIIPAHKSDIWAVRFSPDGYWLASGSVDSTIKIWSRDSGTLLHTLRQPQGVTNLAISPNGDLLASTSYDAIVRLWKLPEGILIKEFKGHQGTVWSVSFSSDGRTIASSGEDATIRLWDIESGQSIRELTGHGDNVWDVKFSPDGTILASGSYDKTVRIWNVNSGQLIHTMDEHSEAIVSLAFSPNGQMLASTSDDKSIKLWNTHDWKLVRSLTVPEHIQASDFSPDSKQLLTGGRDKPAMGEFLQNFLGDSRYNKGVSMRLWEVETGKLLQTFSQHANDVNDVSWSGDGKCIASGSSDHTIELWQLSRVN